MPVAELKSGIQLHYDERGAGEPLLLVMGIGAQMIYWPEGFCDALAARGFRVIRFDNRDVGESSILDHLGVPPLMPTLASSLLGMRTEAPYALEDMADDTAGLLDVLQLDRAHVVGASMGGMIAQTLAITHPGRLFSLTSMMSTTGEPGHLISDPRALRALLGDPPKSREEAVIRTLALFDVIGSKGFDTDRESMKARAAQAFDRGSHPRGFLRQLAAIGKTGDRTARLRSVKTPSLVIHGMDDPLIRPIGGRLTAKAIPGAKLCMIDGMGHDVPKGAWGLLSGLIANHAHHSGHARS